MKDSELDGNYTYSPIEDEPYDPEESSSEEEEPVELIEETEALLKKLQYDRKKELDKLANITDNEEKLKARIQALKNKSKKEEARQKRREDKPPRRKGQPIESQVRHLIAEDITNGEFIKVIAGKYKVSESYVRKMAAEMRKNDIQGEAPPRKKTKPGPTSKFDDDNVKVATLMCIEDHPSWKLRTIVDKIEEICDIDTSITALKRFLDDCDITWKNAVKIPTNWNTCNIIEKRISYVTDLLLKGYSRNWVWVDEVGFNLDQLRRTKALSLAGQKVSVTIQSHSRRLNVISSLGQDGIVLNKFKFSTINKRNDDDSGGVNASDFKGFLFELAAKIPKKSIIILDNAAIHHAEEVKEAYKTLKQVYGIDVMFLPPYSPFLNPIELCFNTIRTRIAKEELPAVSAFRDVIEEAFASVSKEESKGYINHVTKYYEQCKLGLPFKGNILQPDVDERSQSTEK